MRLTSFTDYTLRTLIFLQVHEGEFVSTGVIAETYGISREHLNKVVQHLVALELIEAKRGAGGGIRLGVDAAEIGLGALIRETEEFDLLQCFDSSTDACRISSVCQLKGILQEGLTQFLAHLDGYTLADIASNRAALQRRLQIVS